MLADTPVRGGYAELGGSYTRLRGPEGWLEAGYRPLEQLGLFGRGFVTPDDAGVMAGIRLVF